jgi:hypothetical protein
MVACTMSMAAARSASDSGSGTVSARAVIRKSSLGVGKPQA